MPRSSQERQEGREQAARVQRDDIPVLVSDGQWAYLQRRYGLTPRERQIAEMVCQGLRNARIAEHLRIRPETVKTHIRNIYRKVGVRNKIPLLLRFVSEARSLSDSR
jgi:DNA-binding CsgD family transcriptional regulator